MFQQLIHGGFNFNVLDATTLVPVLQLSANDYKITVANDYTPSNAPIPSDYLSVDFNGFLVPTQDPNIADGAAISGATAFLTAAMSWDADTFTDADEPKLRAHLPVATILPFTGTARTQSPAAFNITTLSRINPSAGDYNFDGKVDSSDYIEWRKAFGGTSESSLHADGNGDGLIDTCDYIRWRDRQGGLNTVIAHVPEPGPVTLAAIALLALAVHRRKISMCRQKI